MSLPVYRVRRAVVDDLPTLQILWATMHFPSQELEKRPTEFQVVESEDGKLLGAVALEISGRQGRIHSEAYLDFGLSDILRQHLWARLQSLATNHGLTRLWTNETAPFWKQNGFNPADAAALKRLPAAWDSEKPDWLTSKLRDEEAVEMALEKEFLRFKMEETQKTDKMMRRGRMLNFIGTALTVALFIGVLTFGFVWVMKNYPHLFGR